MIRVTSRISPEVVAGLLSVVVVLAVIGVQPPSAAPPGPGRSEPTASSFRPTGSDERSPLVRSALETVVVINQRLSAAGDDLEQELARADPQASQVAVLLPRIAAHVVAVGQPVEVLVADPTTARLGSDLSKAYGTLEDLVRAALRQSVQDRAAYLQAAEAAAVLIKKLAPLTERAKALLAGRLESASPAATASATVAPTDSPPPSSRPSPSPIGRSASPSSSAGDLVVNGDFEVGLTPWVLQVASPAAAMLELDRTDAGSGAVAARVEIATSADARSGISLVQSAVPLRAGQTYTIRLLVRAAEARDVRIRLAGTNGDAYVARIFPVSTGWTTIAFTFDVLVDDVAAELVVDLGRAAATTWIDAVALTPAG